MRPEPLVSTHKIGRYQIVREIARSNDIVYEAVDPVMGRRVAVKELLLPPNLVGAQKRERIERFYREAKAAGTLTHPHIVTIYEVGEDQGRHFIAMEFLDGQSLRDVLQMQGLIPVPEALRIAGAIGEALQYAHEHGVIHRDVKPDNIHLLPDGRVKLTDFGIARLMFESTLTTDGQVFGTPSYMSPEQVAGKSIDARSDVFSLGVMLYEMVAGRKPFTGDSVITITYNIMNVTAAPLTGVPASVDRIVARAMAKDPGLRYRSATDMVEEMRAARDGLTHSARAGGFAAPGPSPLRPPQGGLSPPAPGARRPVPGGTAASGPGTGHRAPGTGTPGTGASAAAANPFAQLQPDDMWFPKQRRARRPVSPVLKSLLGNILIVAVIAGIMGFLFWSTMTAYQEFLHAKNRKQATDIAQRAYAAFRSGQFSQAASQFQASWELDPNSDVGRKSRRNAGVAAVSEGDRFLSAGDAQTAARWYGQAVRVDPENADGFDRLGDLAYGGGGGNMRQAGSHWERAIELYSRRAMSRTDAERQEAEKGHERVGHKAATAWINYGDALARGSRVAEARDAWQRAISLAPGTEIAVLAQQRLDGNGGFFGG